MRISELKKIKKLYFSCDDIAAALGISSASAVVTASRYLKQGYIVRFKRNIYILEDVWRSFRDGEKFVLANIGQTPSYVSLMTAIAYYGLTTQVRRGIIESVSIRKTGSLEVKDMVFTYSRIKEPLYGGFKKEDGFFIATPEKAIADAVYLKSLGRYDLDLGSIEWSRVDMKELRKLLKACPRGLNILKGIRG
jgi:predicted transcriptional regulator of viral defense system